MEVRHDTDAVGLVEVVCLGKTYLRQDYKDGKNTYLFSGDPSSCSSVPFCQQETECVSSAKRHTGEKSPLLADKPFLIFDVVRVCEERVKRQEGEGVEMGVPRPGYVEACAGDFRRVDRDDRPGRCWLEVVEGNKETYIFKLWGCRPAPFTGLVVSGVQKIGAAGVGAMLFPRLPNM